MRKNLSKLFKKLTNSLGLDITINRISTDAKHTKVMFVHVPKCGGISIDRALRQALAKPNEAKIRRKPMLASSLYHFEGNLGSIDGQSEFSEFHAKNVQDILTYHLNLKWNYVSGHTPVNKKLLEHYSSEYKFVTLLRNPIDRFISNYIFNKVSNDTNFMLPAKGTCKLDKASIWTEAGDIINSTRGWHLAHTMSLFVTGRYPKDEQDAADMQEEVLSNLKQFAVVGFLDDMSNFEKQLGDLIGSSISIRQHNKTSDFKSDEEQFVQSCLKEYFAQEEVLNKLQSICKTELETFHKAKALFK